MNKRQKEVLEAAFKDEKKVIRELQKVYKDAEKEIDDKIAQLMGRSDANMQHVIYQVEYQKAMKAQIGAILDTMQANQFSFVSEYLTKCYEEGFVGTMYDLQGQGIPLCFPLDQRQVAKAVKLDSKISKGLYSRLGEDVAVLKTKISAEISRGIATGASINQIAQNLAGHSRIGFNNAIRIVRTEGGRITNEAKMEALTRSKAMGADIVKQWDSTLDMKTRPSHRAVDGEVKELEEKFSNGLRFPGDPHGKAAEVINCRCCLLQRARSEFDKEGNERDFTKMNNETGEIMHFDITLDYNNFKKQYWAAAKKMQSGGNTPNVNNSLTNAIAKSGIIALRINMFDKGDPLYIDAFSIEEDPGFEDVCLHGAPDSVQKTIDGNKTNLNAKEFAEILRNSGYEGGDIRLASCSTGKGENSFAQQLSKELGVKVKAPDTDVYYAPDEGVLFVGSPNANIGKWRIFENGVEIDG